MDNGGLAHQDTGIKTQDIGEPGVREVRNHAGGRQEAIQRASSRNTTRREEAIDSKLGRHPTQEKTRRSPQRPTTSNLGKAIRARKEAASRHMRAMRLTRQDHRPPYSSTERPASERKARKA